MYYSFVKTLAVVAVVLVMRLISILGENMLEKDIEKRVCDYAKLKGVLVYKFTSPARAAVPDRLFITPTGRMWFCEFKRSGQKPTPAQQREHLRLQQQNVIVFVIDNVSEGKTMIDVMVM